MGSVTAKYELNPSIQNYNFTLNNCSFTVTTRLIFVTKLFLIQHCGLNFLDFSNREHDIIEDGIPSRAECIEFDLEILLELVPPQLDLLRLIVILPVLGDHLTILALPLLEAVQLGGDHLLLMSAPV